MGTEGLLEDKGQDRIGVWGRDICAETWKVRRGSHTGIRENSILHGAGKPEPAMGEASASFLPPLANSASTALSLVLCAVGTSGSCKV